MTSGYGWRRRQQDARRSRAGAQAARAIRRADLPASAATIDHLVLLDAATAELVAASGASVSYQPGFLQPYGQMLRQVRIDRYATVLGGRMLLNAGIPLAISAPPVARGPSAARRRGAVTALPSTRLHCSPRFSHRPGFLPIFLPKAPLRTGQAARNPLRGKRFTSTLRDRWTGPSKLVMRVRFPSSAPAVHGCFSKSHAI